MNTKHVKSWKNTAVFAATVLSLSGCGGSGTGTSAVNPYAGSYRGVFEDTSNANVVAPISLTVSNAGVVNGSAGTGANALPLTGNVSSSGVTNINSKTYTGYASGTFSSSSSEIVAGTFQGKTNNTIFVTMIKNPTNVTGANPFAGDYIGQIHDTTTNQTGPIAFIVDATGMVNGFSVAPLGGNAYGFAAISGSVSSTGVVNAVGTNNGVTLGTASGNVTLTGVNLAGNLTTNNNGPSGTIALTRIESPF